jgi:hypothetical protein
LRFWLGLHFMTVAIIFFCGRFTSPLPIDIVTAFECALVVGGLVWLPTNREPGANPGRPRRCNRVNRETFF